MNGLVSACCSLMCSSDVDDDVVCRSWVIAYWVMLCQADLLTNHVCRYFHSNDSCHSVSAGASLNEALSLLPNGSKFSSIFWRPFFTRHSPSPAFICISLWAVWAPLPSPSFTLPCMAFHYLWGPFTHFALGRPPVGAFGNSLCPLCIQYPVPFFLNPFWSFC